jgi:16S rRNA (guanine966-N2)-methyltransferase
LRPTPERTRETLFNWLGQRLDGWRCLDLFAGSGALGFEAASRGAAKVILVERDARAWTQLRDHALALDAGDRVDIVRGEGRAFLSADCGDFDLILLDPPFASDFLSEVLVQAATRLKPGGRIYAETDNPRVVEATPGLRVTRKTRAGMSYAYLLERA